MAVTNYYSVGGMLIGEETSGVRTDYLTDALGSVTATVDQTGTVQNTYRYKPYGALLAKTGSAADPAFGWVGKEGYRQTGKRYSEVYVRARHYNISTSSWNTIDPMRWASDWKSYVYAENNPSTFKDPSGELTITTYQRGTALTFCGAATFSIVWGGFTADDNGYIIQHIIFKPSVFLCNCPDCSSTPKPNPANAYISYWEAWQVKHGTVCAGRCNGRNVTPGRFFPVSDTFTTVDEGQACGTVQIIGHVKYIPNYNLYSPPWEHSVTQSGVLPTMTSVPYGWAGAGPSTPHMLTVKFNCCTTPPGPETITTVP